MPRPRVFENLGFSEMVDDMRWYVESHDWATYVELVRRYGEMAKGNLSHGMPSRNIVFWVDMSEMFSEALESLFAGSQRTIHPHPSSYLVYFIDGGSLKMPLAKRPPKNGYREPHWAPVSFRPGARCERDKDCPWFDLEFVNGAKGSTVTST